MQALVRFYADYRIKQHASLRLLRNRLIFFVFSIDAVLTRRNGNCVSYAFQYLKGK